jgi:hypothetical protein
MPDDHDPLMPRRNPERIDLAAIKTDLEFLMERLSKLPTCQELALRPLYVIFGGAAAFATAFGETAGICEDSPTVETERQRVY